MPKLFGKFGKAEIVAVLTLSTMFTAAIAVPVQSDISEKPATMEFDSVGSMLRDMDREVAVNDISRHSDVASYDIGTIASYNIDAARNECDSDPIEDRVSDLRASLNNSVDYTLMVRAIDSENYSGVAQLNALAEASDAALRDYVIERDSLEARSAAMERFAAMAVMMQTYGDEELAEMDDAVLAAKIEAAMRAAEAAINKNP